MASNKTNIKGTLNLEPIAGNAPAAEGDVAYDSTAHKASLHNGTTASPVVTEAHTQTLTNKTIAAGSNTVSGLTNSNLSGSAAITNANMANMASSSATVGTVKGNISGSATTPSDITLTSANTASSAVYRDSSGNFSAGTITATLSGNATNVSGTVVIGNGGTGQTTKAAAFDALSPMTTSGDIIYGGASGTGTRLAKGSDGTFLTLASGIPSWSSVGNTIAVTTKTANYTATSSDDLILCNTNAFTVTLPAASSNSGKVLRIQKIGSDTNAITIARAGSDTINGATSYLLSTQYEEVMIVSDGSATWYVIAHAYPSLWTAYTPTVSAGAGTASSISFFWRRAGDSIHIKGSWTNGTVAASLVSFTLPNSWSVSSAKCSLNNTTANPGNFAGTWTHAGLSGEIGNLVTAPATDATQIYLADQFGHSNNATPSNGNAIMGSTGTVVVWAQVPISGWQG